jgi:cell division protein FtsI/penicillin-binding protein 2
MLDDETTVACALPPPDNLPLTLSDAYLYGCPSPFASLAESLGANSVETIFNAFRVNQPVILEGFVPQNVLDATQTPAPQPTGTLENTLVRNALGQGQQQAISPLNMALIAAAVSNHGNAPTPRTLLAVRPRDGEWQSIPPDGIARPYLASAAAQRLTELMTTNMLSDVLVTPQPQYALSGHAGIAYSGKGKTLSWFIGFITLPDTTQAAVAIVVEDVNDPKIAAQIGQSVLIAAYDQQAAP